MSYKYMLAIFLAISLHLNSDFNDYGHEKNVECLKKTSMSLIPKLAAKSVNNVMNFEFNENINHIQEILELKAPEIFKKSSKSVKLAKSNKVPYGIWYDPINWKITKNYNGDAEFSFGLIGKDAYAFIIN